MSDSLVTPVVIVLPDGRMDRKNAAAYLGLSAKTLAIKASNGTGPKFIKRGRVWYRKADLDAWLNGAEVRSTAQARYLNHEDTERWGNLRQANVAVRCAQTKP